MGGEGVDKLNRRYSRVYSSYELFALSIVYD